MVRQMGLKGSKNGYFTKNSKGKSVEINRDGSIREYHEKWDDPVREPERKPKKSKSWEIPGIPYEHPPDFLVPVGGGFYVTPVDEKVSDPTNCEGNLAEISPWCGGNPFSRQAIGLNPEIKFDECNIWVEFQPVLVFVKLAPGQIAYRFPGDCRKEPPPDPPPTPPTPGTVNLRGMGKFGGYEDDDWVYMLVTNMGNNNDGENDYGSKDGRLICPGGVDPFHTSQGTHPVASECTEVQAYYGTEYYRKEYYWEPDVNTYYCDAQANIRSMTWRNHTTVYDPNVVVTDYYTWQWNGFLNSGNIWYGKVKILKAALLKSVQAAAEDYHTVEYGYSSTISVDDIVYQFCGKPNPYKKNPPPPLPRDKPCCMACCNPAPENSDLLKKILAECVKANKAIGSDDLPAPFRKVLNRSDDSTEQIENLAQLGKRLAVYLDGVAGEWPVKMKFKDTDATQAGDQSAEMEVDNIAEMLAESFGIAMSSSINSELLIQLVSKALIELSITRKQLHTTQSKIEAMEKYLGYDVREDKQNVPFTISVPQSSNINDFSMDDFLKPSEQPVEIAKISKDEIGAHKKYMLMLQKTSQIINAVFWRKLVKGGVDLADQMRNLLKNENKIVDDVDKHDKDLEAFLEDYERGFTGYTGYQGDASQPYGDSFDERPKTRIIKKPLAPPS